MFKQIHYSLLDKLINDFLEDSILISDSNMMVFSFNLSSNCSSVNCVLNKLLICVKYVNVDSQHSFPPR